MLSHPEASRGQKILDVSRLLSRLHRDAPTGIDRVELAYAREFAKRSNVRFSATTPINTGLLPRRNVELLMQSANERWSAIGASAAIDEVSRLQARFDGGLQHPRRQATGERRRSAASARWAINTAYLGANLNAFFDAQQSDFRPEPSWYIHLSHMNLHKPDRFRWIRRGSPRCMFYVHDLIPLTHPEHFLPGEDERHRVRMQTVARLADLVVFNSTATQKAWDDFVSGKRLPAPHGVVVPLGVEDAFLKREQATSLHASLPYFVVVGTVESRKNLSFLLHVWKRWIEQSSSVPARLVIVGRRGRHSENAVDLIDRSAALAPAVIEASDLSDAGAVALLRGARALLAPSLIEGFGLPIAEALALGVPVIASDIAAHREAGGNHAEYLDPVDGSAWRQALSDYSDPDSERRKQRLLAAQSYVPMSWPDHIRRIEALLEDTGK